MQSLLIIEDDELLAMLLHRVLSDAGYCCTTALRLNDVIDRVQQLGHVDLVLADVVMPEGTSFASVDLIKMLFPDARVIVMSGFTQEYAAQHGRELDEDWVFLQKPFATTALLRLVEQQLELKEREAVGSSLV